MKLSTLFGVSAIITGAVAITGNSSITGKPSSISPNVTITVSEAINSSAKPDYVPPMDQVYIKLGAGEHCNSTHWEPEHYMPMGLCHSRQTPFTTLHVRLVPGWYSIFARERCVLVTFTDDACTFNGAILDEFNISDDEDVENRPACTEVHLKPFGTEINGHSVKWVCGKEIDPTWPNPFPPSDDDDDDLLVSGRSVDTEGGHDRVTVTPADGFNCVNAQSRDTDTKHQDRCHSFDKAFFSLSATVKRATHDSIFGGSEPCAVLAFSDKECSRDGASIVNLNHTPSLGVCHNVSLHHGKDVAAIAGHSWKWICGRQNIDDCLKPVHHSKSSKQVYPRPTSIVSSGVTKTVTATTSLACSITTDSAHYIDVLTSVVTLKPVTHVSTSIFTKTKTHLHTKLITSVATDVSTIHHSVTKPYKTTYMVCDVRETPQA